MKKLKVRKAATRSPKNMLLAAKADAPTSKRQAPAVSPPRAREKEKAPGDTMQSYAIGRLKKLKRREIA